MRIKYEGPAPYASFVAQKLGEEGLDVAYTPTVEARSAQDAVELVVVYMSLKVVDGLTDHAIDAIIDRVKAALGDRLKSIKLRREN
jgi:hypothetical protein